MKILIVIPVRWKSSRFVGKPLANILGKPMLEYVWNNAKKSNKTKNVVIGTDNKKIFTFCRNRNINVLMTSVNALTGTDRVFMVSKKIHADIYVNLQGDEPLINSKNIDKLIDYLIKNLSKGFSAALGYYEENSNNKINKFKPKTYLVKSIENKLLYLSRSPIPTFFSSKKKKKRFVSLGIFAFTKKILKKFSNYKKTELEIRESVEMLRLIENNEKILCVRLNEIDASVDYPSDIKKVEKLLKK